MAITVGGTTITFNDGTTQSTAAAAVAVNVQTFNTTGTWNKPTGGQTMARIQVWGGGGGGNRNSCSGSVSGGGGGAYNEITIPLSYLASSVTATVGAGGAGATSTASGGNGGVSSFALATAWDGLSTLAAYGGLGATPGPPKASGGGLLSAGSGNAPGTPLIITAYAGGSTIYAYYEGSSGTITVGCSGYPVTTGGIYHGGGGGPLGTAAGGSIWGGGGGASTTALRGLSGHGGAGGGGAGGAGTAPGGGGGCGTAANQNGGTGAAGRIVVTCW